MLVASTASTVQCSWRPYAQNRCELWSWQYVAFTRTLLRGRAGQHDAIVDGARSCGIARQPDGLGDPEGLAGRNVTLHNLLAGRGRLAGTHVTVQQHVERMSVLALTEDRAFLANRNERASLRIEMRSAGESPANMGRCATTELCTVVIIRSYFGA